MAINKVRKNFHQARWDGPIIYELSTPGVRGILPPEVEDEISASVGDVAGGLPDCADRPSRGVQGEGDDCAVSRESRGGVGSAGRDLPVAASAVPARTRSRLRSFDHRARAL